MMSRFTVNGVISFGAASGSDDRKRVRVERQHRVAAADHLAVPDVDAVERADRDASRARSTSGSR